MNIARIALADGDKSARRLLEMALSMEPDFQVAVVTDSGRDLLSQLEAHPVDVVMLDLVLRDGSFAETLSCLLLRESPPKLLLTGNLNPQVLSHWPKAAGLPYLRKPFSLARGIQRLRRLLDDSSIPPLELRIDHQAADFLRDCGAPSHRKGYGPLKAAIQIAVVNPECLQGVMTGLYADLAARYGVTVSQLERNIRGVIGDIWSQGNPELLGRCFDRPAQALGQKPGNVAFIRAAARWVREGVAELKENP